jgi:hypothetical protein
MVVHIHVLVVIQKIYVCMCAFVSIRHLLTLDGHGAVMCKLGSGDFIAATWLEVVISFQQHGNE